MTGYFLTGPIDLGDKFTISTQRNGLFYVLDSYQDAQNRKHYFLNSTLVSNGQVTPPVELSTKGTLQSLQITDTAGGALSYNNELLIGNAIQGLPLSPTQNQYMDWGTPVVFLTGVNYSLQTKTGGTVQFEYGSGSAEAKANTAANKYLLAEQLVMIPRVWYFGCSSSSSGQVNDSLTQSVLSAWCTTNQSNSACTNIQLSGFTQQADCVEGVNYSYCPVNVFCSNGSCKGPCSKSYDSCDYNSDTSQFACKFQINNVVKGEWWKSTWFIALLIGFGVLIIIAFILLGIYLSRRRQANASQTESALAVQ
jgi:hypothetical protein